MKVQLQNIQAQHSTINTEVENVHTQIRFSEVIQSLAQHLQAPSESIEVKNIPNALKSMIELQRDVHAHHLKVELLTKSIDGFQSGIKRLSQQGA